MAQLANGGPAVRSTAETRLTDARRDQIDAMIRANIGLAYSESRRWGSDLNDDDRISAGLDGLQRACERFDPNRGRLATAASWFIRAACTLARNRQRTHTRDRIVNASTATRFARRIQIQQDRDPARPTDVIQGTEEASQQSDVLYGLLSLLKPKQRMVIEMRFGFRNGRKMTPLEIANLMGVCRERVRQIERDALAIMRGASP